MLFRPDKWSCKRVEKNRHFAKGLVHGFCQKATFFLNNFFEQKNPERNLFLIFWIVNNAFWTSKVKYSQSRKKSTFCTGVSPWFCPKIDLFLTYFFFSKKGQKETFFHILDRKECFLDLKSEVLKNSKKIEILQRG